MDELLTLNAAAALFTLAILEIVLGIDNIVFLAILTGKLPEHQQPRARRLGLALAAIGRISLLVAISWVITLEHTTLFVLPFDVPGGSPAAHQAERGARQAAPPAGQAPAGDIAPDEDKVAADKSPAPKPHTTPISAKDLVLLLGGLFLLAKSTWEIGHAMEPKPHGGVRTYPSMIAALAQIVVIDLVFSIDSVLTAVGMVRPEDYQHHWAPLVIMVTAVLLAIGVMLIFSGPIAAFVNRHPSVKMLALAFLILIGMVLVAEGLHSHVPRGYVYFAMAFSLLVEMLNLRAAKRALETEGHSAAP